jgi:hypothetical protein
MLKRVVVVDFYLFRSFASDSIFHLCYRFSHWFRMLAIKKCSGKSHLSIFYVAWTKRDDQHQAVLSWVQPEAIVPYWCQGVSCNQG